VTGKKLLDPAERGRKGGKTRAARLSPEERRNAARRAALARWQGTTAAQRREVVGKLVLARWQRARRTSRGDSGRIPSPDRRPDADTRQGKDQ
jgi:hypothetical protein